MRIDLFKSLEGASYYGDIPEAAGLPDSQVETKYYYFNAGCRTVLDYAILFNDACGTLLDIGDVDFFDVRKCKDLIALLEKLEPSPDENMAVFLSDLKEYAQRAIDFGTGIVVELSL